jgi:type IV pilus assembly protein PilQ
MLVLVTAIFSASQAAAATIEKLQLLSDQSGQSISISLDEATEYQVFDLEAPKRLVLSFPNSVLSKDINPLQGEGGVEGVFPVQNSAGVRLEIGLTATTSYSIEEKGNDLLVSFETADKSAGENLGAVLKELQIRDRGSVTELVLRGDHLDINRNSLITNEGKSMVIDFWGGESKLPREYFSYTNRRVKGVTVGSSDGRLRLVVSLLSGTNGDHQIEASPNQMIVRFGNIASKPTTAGLVVEAVDFQPEDRISHLVVRTNAANPIINLQEKDGSIILDLKQASLAEGQERSQDVRAFPGAVKQIDSYAINEDVRIVARLRDKVAVTSFQTGNVLTVTIKPQDMVAKQADEGEIRDEQVYTGQKVSFDFKDIDIHNALKLIAEMSELNIIMSDDVAGVLTMRLIDVPWDQALDLILDARGLGYEKTGNVMRIAPLAQLKKDSDARKDARASAEEIAPLETEFIRLGYASINDVSTILKGQSLTQSAGLGGASGNRTVSKASGGISGSGGLKLLSNRGSILLDERSNTMIITDTRDRLNNIKRLIAVIDKPMQQVLIEARIVEASNTFSHDLGVRWGGSFNSGRDAAGNITNQFAHGVAGGIGGNVVDLGAAVSQTGGAIGYTLGTFSNALNLNLELSAAEAEGRVKVASSPRIFTSNLQEALIEQDEQIPFDQVTTTGGTTTITPIFKSAKLTLRVTPQITADQRIIMELKVNKDTPVINTAGTATAINTKTIETRLLVKNGETVVLGGIYSQTVSNSVVGVPVLKDIPWIGTFFRRTRKSNNRNELLIFITPTIIGLNNNKFTQR